MAIRNTNVAEDAGIAPSKIAYRVPAKHTDGTLPKTFHVSKGGYDGLLSGGRDDPFLTIGAAKTAAVSGRFDMIRVSPGSYAETLDIDKEALTIAADGVDNPGLVQIVGDGSTARATVRVLSNYVRGFRLLGIELDVTTVTQDALHIQTSNVDAATATNPSLRFVLADVHVRSTGPRTGFMFEGATLGSIKRSTVAGPTTGVAFAGSLNNFCADLIFEDMEFYDNVTADVATHNGVGNPGVSELTNVVFHRTAFTDVGGTPVTNFINYHTASVVINCAFLNCNFSRTVANGTRIATMPPNLIVNGWDTSTTRIGLVG